MHCVGNEGNGKEKETRSAKGLARIAEPTCGWGGGGGVREEISNHLFEGFIRPAGVAHGKRGPLLSRHDHLCQCNKTRAESNGFDTRLLFDTLSAL